jgi:transposase
MSDGSKVQPSTTAGLDLGDKYSYLCLVDQESGEIVEEGRLRTNPETFKRRFASERPPMRIAIEAGTHSPWVSRVLEECGHEVLVANARKTRLIYANKRKTDEIDAENLARLARLDPKLLYPLKHRGVRIPRLIWRSSARVRRWSVAARSWSITSAEPSNPSVGDCPSARL